MTEPDMVWVQLPAEDVAFIRGFDPDRDRSASRADMVRVVEHLQAALSAPPGVSLPGRRASRAYVPGDSEGAGLTGPAPLPAAARLAPGRDASSLDAAPSGC